MLKDVSRLDLLKTHHCVAWFAASGLAAFVGADGPSEEGPTGSGLGRACSGLGSKLV